MSKKTLNLDSLEVALHKAGAYMSVAARAEDAIIFMGTTKSGKSSLVNYLIGNKLTGVKIGHRICIRKADNSHGPQIGVAATSETAIPSRFILEKLPGFALWDAPGFEDNRGPNTDICNAFYISELFKNIRSAKIILVVDVVTFRDDSLQAVRTLLRAIENLLTDKFADSFPGIGMIVTKVDMSQGFQALIEYVTDSLRVILTDDIDVSKCGKELVQHLIGNTQKIGFFKKATEGPITSGIAVGITEAIFCAEAVPDVILKEISPSISESAKVALFEAREEFSSIQKFVDLQAVVAKALQNKLWHDEILDNILNADTLMDLQTELSIIRSMINKVLDETVSFEKTIAALKMTDQTIEEYIDKYKLCEKAKHMEFADRLLNLEHSRNFDICIKNVLLLAKQQAEELVVQIKFRMGEISKGKLDEEIAKITKQYECKIIKFEKEIETLKYVHLKQAKKKEQSEKLANKCKIS